LCCCAEAQTSEQIEEAVVTQQKSGSLAGEKLPALLASVPQEKVGHVAEDRPADEELVLPAVPPAGVLGEAPAPLSAPIAEEAAPPSEPDCAAETKATDPEEGRGSEEKEEMAKPDFRGEWKMMRCEGDWDAFMKEVGVGWALRKAAGAQGYGVNKNVHAIKITGELISIETRTGLGTYVREFKANRSEHDGEDPISKKPIKILAYWEEVAGRMSLTQEGYTPAAKAGGPVKKQPLARRWLEGTDMVVEQTTANGVIVKSFFSKMG